MTLWALKVVPSADWKEEQDKFEDQFLALKEPEDMMLVMVEAPDLKSARFFIELPDGVPLDHYSGFQKISDHSLPDTAALIIGYEHRFNKFFGLPGSSDDRARDPSYEDEDKVSTLEGS